MAKLHFRSYTTNQMVLFPQRIDENIAENDPVRIVSSIAARFMFEHAGVRLTPYKPTGRRVELEL